MRYHRQCQPKKLRTFPQVAYSQFSVSIESLVAPIPDALSYEQAATLPLSITLAAAGLYQRNHLDSPLPRSLPRVTGETILVMDGASDVGAMVIQLATASNMRVVATASRRNVDIVKSFGASVVVCHDPFVERELVAALDSFPLAGVYDTMSTKQSFAEIDALLHETMQTTPVCALMPPAQSPMHFSPSVGKFLILRSCRIPKPSQSPANSNKNFSSRLNNHQPRPSHLRPRRRLARVPPTGLGEA